MKPKDMNQAVADYLDQIVGFVKPTSTVYIAIDGVAPRAKMEQQKDRRYKSVKLSKARRTIQQRFKQQVRETLTPVYTFFNDTATTEIYT